MYFLNNKAFPAVKSLLLANLFFLSFSVFANEPEHAETTPVEEHAAHGEKAETEKKFNAGEMIIHHIVDAHEWHIAGHLSIPLPVILYSSTKGIKIFSSSRFEHGHASYEGYKYDENHHIVAEDGSSFLDLSITKNVAALLFSVVLMLWMFISVANSYKKRKGQAPKGLQSAIEPLILFIRDDVAKAAIGEKKYKKYMPFLLTAFFFIWINNLLGIVPIFPGGANLTGNIAVTMTLAIFTLLIVTFSANRHYWRHIFAMPGVPVGILGLLTPIEILSFFLRPFVLMVRLFANMLAGHIIALSFFALIFIFGEMNAGLGLGVSVVSLGFTIFMTLLELLVTFLQAYVFTLLSAIYIGAAVEEHHAHEPHTEDHVAAAAIV